MAAANTGRPHRRKERIPPGDAARAAAAALRAAADPANSSGTASAATGSTNTATVTDLAAYERAATARSRK